MTETQHQSNHNHGHNLNPHHNANSDNNPHSNRKSNSNHNPAKKIILAYSGGLDTSIAIPWLKEEYGYDVIALCADLGEGKDLQAIREKALAIGALDCIVVDCKALFAEQYLAPALKANLRYEGCYPLISALSRPLIAKLLVDCAAQHGATAVAHGCTGKGNDQVRFEVSIKALAPHLDVIAPVRENALSRDEAFAYAEKHHIPLSINQANPFSIDLNLWGRSCECGELEDPACPPPEAAFEWTTPLVETPNTPTLIELEFKHGVPISLNGKALAFEALITELNQIAGAHGIGRIDHIENRLIGIKSREVYEAPAALTLIQAHQALEALCLTGDCYQFKVRVEQQLANCVYNGYWYSPLATALQAFVDSTQQTVSGVVKLKLFKGHAIVQSRQSVHSLYQPLLATYTAEDQFDHHAAAGFVKCWGLPLAVHAAVNQQADYLNPYTTTGKPTAQAAVTQAEAKSAKTVQTKPTGVSN